MRTPNTCKIVPGERQLTRWGDHSGNAEALWRRLRVADLSNCFNNGNSGDRNSKYLRSAGCGARQLSPLT